MVQWVELSPSKCWKCRMPLQSYNDLSVLPSFLFKSATTSTLAKGPSSTPPLSTPTSISGRMSSSWVLFNRLEACTLRVTRWPLISCLIIKKFNDHKYPILRLKTWPRFLALIGLNLFAVSIGRASRWNFKKIHNFFRAPFCHLTPWYLSIRRIICNTGENYTRKHY